MMLGLHNKEYNIMPVPEGYPFPLPFDNNVGQDAFREVPEAPFLLDVDDEFKQSNCYNGNMSLKANGVKVPITPEHKAEFKRCQHDVFYFLMNYGKIISLDDGEIKFKLFQYQKNMIKLMHENRFVINLLPRQMGKCSEKNTKIKIRHKKTGDIRELTVEEFHELTKKGQ